MSLFIPVVLIPSVGRLRCKGHETTLPAKVIQHFRRLLLVISIIFSEILILALGPVPNGTLNPCGPPVQSTFCCVGCWVIVCSSVGLTKWWMSTLLNHKMTNETPSGLMDFTASNQKKVHIKRFIRDRALICILKMWISTGADDYKCFAVYSLTEPQCWRSQRFLMLFRRWQIWQPTLEVHLKCWDHDDQQLLSCRLLTVLGDYNKLLNLVKFHRFIPRYDIGRKLEVGLHDLGKKMWFFC